MLSKIKFLSNVCKVWTCLVIDWFVFVAYFNFNSVVKEKVSFPTVPVVPCLCKAIVKVIPVSGLKLASKVWILFPFCCVILSNWYSVIKALDISNPIRVQEYASWSEYTLHSSTFCTTITVADCSEGRFSLNY